MAKLTDKNRLSIINPELCKEWDNKKNGGLKPENVSYGSHKKVWWLCKKGHKWKALISDRNSGKGCPYCAGKKVCKDNCLGLLYPDLIKEWDNEKNGDLTPYKVTYGSNKKVWWLCNNGHSWKTCIWHRAMRRHACPYCDGQKITPEKSLAVTNPQLSSQWHPFKNGILTPSDVGEYTNKKVWWKYKEDEWQASVSARSISMDNGNEGRPNVNCDNRLSSNCPEVAKEWNFTQNGKLTPNDISVGSSKKVWWECNKGHEWEASICNRTGLGSKCPYCCGQKVNDENCLETKFPKIAKEWHPTKNGCLTPKDVSGGSSKKCWWLCKKGHEWQAYITNRTNQQTQCPRCKGVDLKDGTHCASVPEAWVYLQYKKENKRLFHDQSYGGELSTYKYDFYLIDENTYVEVTSYDNNFHGYYNKNQYIGYLRGIVKKRRYVENVLHAKFKFIQFEPNRSQRIEVLKNRK